MNKPIQKNNQLPEILYEAPSYPGEACSPIPYIESNKTNPMPASLFVFEYFDTGEIEPDEKGKPANIVDQIPHHYVDMALIQKLLGPKEFDTLRVALGMKPLSQAQEQGKVVIDRVLAKQEELKNKAEKTQEERVQAHKQALEKSKAN